jgi:urea transporter
MNDSQQTDIKTITEKEAARQDVIRRLSYNGNDNNNVQADLSLADKATVKRELVRRLSHREEEKREKEVVVEESKKPKKCKIWNDIFNEIFFSGYMPKSQSYLLNNSFFSDESSPATDETANSTNYYLYVLTRTLFSTFVIIDIILRGISQVYLCNHPITGIFICVGLALSSTKLVVYAIVGTICSTFAGSFLCLPGINEIASGLCGYDGALIGCAVSTFLIPSDVMHPNGTEGDIAAALSSKGMVITAMLSGLSGVIHMSCRNMSTLPALTASFNICCLMMLFTLTNNRSSYGTLVFSTVEDESVFTTSDTTPWTAWSFMFVYEASVRGVGQFMFVDTTLGGWMVITGIGVCSRYGAFSSLLGGFVGCITSRCILQVTPYHLSAVRNGLYGYNAAGTLCSFAGSIFYHSSVNAWAIAVLAAGFTTFFQVAVEGVLYGDGMQFPSLTIPFVLSTWFIMLSRSAWLDPLAGDGESFDDLRWKAHALGSELQLGDDDIAEVIAQVAPTRGLYRRDSWKDLEPGQLRRRYRLASAIKLPKLNWKKMQTSTK